MLHTSPRREECQVAQVQQSRRWPTSRQLRWAGATVGLLTIAVLIGYRYGITLWDWIKLLIVPTAIAGAGLWFNTQQREREQRIADNRAQDDSLSTVARARTLTVLGRLDSGRKRSV